MKISHLFLILFSFLIVSCKQETKQAYQEKNVEVLIVGGTTSGTSAGITSARLGVETLIVEYSPWLGGMFSSQGVGAADGNHNLPSGIWKEFRNKIYEYYGGADSVSTGWVSNTLFEPHVAANIFKTMTDKESKLEVIYNYYLTDIIKEGDKVVGAWFENDNKEKLKVNAKITIDATDIGESLKMAGADYRLGMDASSDTGEANAPQTANDIVQDLTWVAVLKDYGVGADKTIEKPEGYNPENFRGVCKDSLNPSALDCAEMLDYGKMPNNKYMINWPNKGNDIYLNVIEMSHEDRKKELEKAKNYTLQFVYYIQSELGFKNLGLADDEFDTPDLLAYAPYHREGRRLKGMAYLNYNHVAQPYDQKEKLYRTGISVGDYPVDHHHKQNPNAPDVGFPPVPSFNIPLGSLIPQKIDGLIVADKPISVSNLINGSTRLQPVVLLTGQAAGTLAALAVKENKQPRQVSIRTVQSSLLNNQTYILPLFDVQPTDQDFATLQKIASTGILKTTGESYKWANRTWFYPDSKITVQEFTEGLSDYSPSIQAANSKQILTEKQAYNYIVKAGGKAGAEQEWSEKPIDRRSLAKMLDTYLNPFEREIDYDGSFK